MFEAQRKKHKPWEVATFVGNCGEKNELREHTVTGFPPITLQYGLFPRIDGITQLYTHMHRLNEIEYKNCLK